MHIFIFYGVVKQNFGGLLNVGWNCGSTTTDEYKDDDDDDNNNDYHYHYHYHYYY